MNQIDLCAQYIYIIESSSLLHQAHAFIASMPNTTKHSSSSSSRIYIVYLHTQMGFKRDSRFAFSPSPGVEDRCIFQIKKWGGLGGKEGIMALAKKENHKKSNNTSIKCRFFGAEKSV